MSQLILSLPITGASHCNRSYGRGSMRTPCTSSQEEENSKHRISSSSAKSCISQKLENIDENRPIRWLPAAVASAAPVITCDAPETPTESMEFLARSWSVSAKELSKALSSSSSSSNTIVSTTTLHDHNLEKPAPAAAGGGEAELLDASSTSSKDSSRSGGTGSASPPISPRDSEEMKELFLLHQALNQDFLSGQQLLKSGVNKNMMKGRTMGRWLKDQKERKKQEIRTHNAQIHAALSVAGVATAIAALAASNAMSAEMAPTACHQKQPPAPLSKTTAAVASAAALVASHCIEMAEDMGADHDQILTVVNSAVNARTNGDIMTLTAGAATALRGAATLKARLQKGYGNATGFALAEEKGDGCKEQNASGAVNFVTRGGELLKRTRKGALHWKQVSFKINSSWQVIVKMKSKHMAGTFTKKKKCVVTGVQGDIPGWPAREKEDFNGDKAYYFGIKTADRIIEFECRSRADKQLWVEGVQYLLNCRSSVV